EALGRRVLVRADSPDLHAVRIDTGLEENASKVRESAWMGGAAIPVKELDSHRSTVAIVLRGDGRPATRAYPRRDGCDPSAQNEAERGPAAVSDSSRAAGGAHRSHGRSPRGEEGRGRPVGGEGRIR